MTRIEDATNVNIDAKNNCGINNLTITIQICRLGNFESLKFTDKFNRESIHLLQTTTTTTMKYTQISNQSCTELEMTIYLISEKHS